MIATGGELDPLSVRARALMGDVEDIARFPSAAADKAVIGVVLPLTGEYAPYGEAALRGVRLLRLKSTA